MRRTLTIALTILMFLLVAVLPAFGEGQQEEGAAEEPVELEWMMRFWQGFADTDVVFTEKIEEVFPDIDLTVTMIPARQLNERYNLMVASGDLPNIMPMWRGGGKFHELAFDGVLATLNEYWNEEDYPNLVNAFTDEHLEISTMVDGNIHGIYRVTTNIERMLGIRQDWLDAVGMDIPTNTEELLEVARAFTYEDPDGDGEDNTWGFAVDSVLAEPMWWMNGTFHVNYVDSFHFVPRPDDGDEFAQEPSIWQPGIDEALAFLREAYAEGVIVPDSVTLNASQIVSEYLETDRLGMFGVDNAADFAEQNMVIIPPPEGPFGRPEVPTRSPVWSNYVINAISSDAQIRAALSIWDWMMTEEGAEFVEFGREGDHWTERREDGTPIVSQEVFEERRWGMINGLPKPPDDPRADIAPFLQGTPEGRQLVEDIQTWQEYAIDIPTQRMGEVPDSFPRRADVMNNVWGTALAIVTGDEPLSALDTMRENINERVMLEVTRDVNELLSSN
jgi:putative aldouronate transport system substrate-binding protein